MMRNALLLAGAVAALASAGHSQTGETKKTGPGQVEVTFANGSLVRMTLLAEKIEIDTPYGKLLVPVRDIRRIDFGLHLPEGADKKIEAAIKQLASVEFKERDAALRELVALGAYAYPALLQAAKSGEPETAKRAQAALAQIKVRVPAKDLYLGEEDRIVTPRFTIVGRILSKTIKAKSEYFPEVALALASLRQVRGIGEAHDTDVVVDAGKYAQPNQWLDTGITVGTSRTLVIAAGGEIDLRPTLPGNYVCGPRGFNAKGAPGFGAKKKGVLEILGRAYPGTLLGRIGENGDTFVVGDRFEGLADREGKLYLQVNSSPYDNAPSGSFQVKVTLRD